MQTGVKVIRGGTTYNLDDLVSYFHLDHEGIGMPPVERLQSSSPFQVGATDFGFKIRPRTLTVLFLVSAYSPGDYYVKRDALLRIFSPSTTPITFQFQYPDAAGNPRYVRLDAHYVGGLDLPESDRTYDLKHKVGLQLYAPNPIWYESTLQSKVWGIVSNNYLIFPITFSIQFCDSLINQGYTIAYAGSWVDYPTFIITGPCNNPKIQNLSTTPQSKIELTYVVDVGETVTIDLTPGVKSITSNTDGNILGALTTDSDLAGFHLAPDTEVTGGNNDIKATLTGATPGTTQLQMTWRNRYLGI